MNKKQYLKLALSIYVTGTMCVSLIGCPGGNTPGTNTAKTNTASTSTVQAQQGQGIIKGTVYKSGIKTASFNIFAEAKGDAIEGAKVVATSSIDVKEITTKSDGSFELPVKSGADYTVEAAFADDTGALVKRTTTVKVPPAQDPQIIDIGSLITRRTGSIQGLVQLEDGKSPEGADIFIPGTSCVGKAHEKGRFALTGIDEGSWKAVFQKAGYETGYVNVDVKSGRPTLVDGQIVLKKANPTAGISGKITNSQGQPIPGVLITAFLLNKADLAKDRPDALDNYVTTTDFDGNYALLNLPTLRDKGVKYSIQYYRAFYDYVSPVELELLSTDMPKKVDDITMKSNLAYFGQIKGKVVDDKGNPIDGAVIQTEPQVTDQKYADANGNFTLDRVMAGEYQMSIAAGGYCEVVMPIALFNAKNTVITLEQPVVLKENKGNNDCTTVTEPIPTPSPSESPIVVPPTAEPTPLPTPVITTPPTTGPTPVPSPTAIKTPPPADVETAGFLGWYIYDDLKLYETISNPKFLITYYGDPNSYYYEPSGGHGLMISPNGYGLDSASKIGTDSTATISMDSTATMSMDSTSTMPADVAFKDIENLVLTHVDKLNTADTFYYDTSSEVSTYKEASYTYALAYLYVPKGDTAKYTLSIGTVDDGASILVNANKMGYLKLGQSGTFDLNKNLNGQAGVLKPGRNTIAIILVDNSRVQKYIHDVKILKDGVQINHLDPKKFGTDIVG